MPDKHDAEGNVTGEVLIPFGNGACRTETKLSLRDIAVLIPFGNGACRTFDGYSIEEWLVLIPFGNGACRTPHFVSVQGNRKVLIPFGNGACRTGKDWFAFRIMES